MSDILVDIGMSLKKCRKENRFTQAETASLLEMSLNFYGDIERGKCRLSIEKIVLAHERLGIDPTYLLTGEEHQTMQFFCIYCLLTYTSFLLCLFYNYLSEKLLCSLFRCFSLTSREM